MPPETSYKPIPKSELEIKAQCGKQGAGGQAVNKTASAIRIFHPETGLSVFINGRSQKQNLDDAMRIITARVNEYKNNNSSKSYNELRKQTIGDGGRGAKIRTYNYIENRVTNHLTGKKVHDVDSIIKKGKFDLILTK